MPKIVKVLKRTFLGVILAIFLIFGTLSLVVQIPSVQLSLVNGVGSFLTERTGYDISVDKVSLRWIDRGAFYGFKVFDTHQNLMLGVKEIILDYDLYAWLKNRNPLVVNKVILDSAHVGLVKYSDKTGLNILDFLNALPSDTTKNQIFTVDQLVLRSVNLMYENVQRDTLVRGLVDLNHLEIGIKEGRLNNIQLGRGELEVGKIAFVGYERRSGLVIANYESNLSFDQNELILKDLEFLSDSSNLKGDFQFSYSHPRDLANFLSLVDIKAELKESSIHNSDFKKVNLNFPENYGKLLLSSNLEGTVDRLTLKGLNFEFQNGLIFKGDAAFSGLPNIENTFMDIEVTELKYPLNLLGAALPSELTKSEITYTGNLLGFIKDFVGKGRINTVLGEIDADINLKIPASISEMSYSGQLRSLEFDPSMFMDNGIRVNKLRLVTSLNGKGIRKNNFELNTETTISSLELNEYNLGKIQISGDLRPSFYSLGVNVNGLLGKLSGDILIDQQRNAEFADINVAFDSLSLIELGLSKSQILSRFEVDASVRNLDWATAFGSVLVSDIEFMKGNESFYFDDIDVKIDSLSDLKLYVKSSDVEAKFHGPFDPQVVYNNLLDDFRYFSNFEGISGTAARSYSNSSEPYSLDLSIEGNSLENLFELVGTPLHFSEDFNFLASIDYDSNSQYRLQIGVDSILYKNRSFIDNSLSYEAVRSLEKRNILVNGQILSKKQSWDLVANTQNFELDLLWINQDIDTKITLEAPASQSKAVILSKARLHGDSITIRTNSEELNGFAKPWRIDSNNLATYKQGSWQFENCSASSEDQEISFEGSIEPISTRLDLAFENFQLSNISTIIPREFGGVLNGKATYYSDEEVGVSFNSNSTIMDLSFEDIHVGNLSGLANWDSELKAIDMDYQLVRENVETINLDGQINPRNDEDQIDLLLNFERANFNLIEPFFSSLVSNVSGFASGSIEIDGPLRNPTLEGKADFFEGRSTIDYLNTTYSFNGTVDFSPGRLVFSDTEIIDRFGNKGDLSGIITHSGFKNPNFDIAFDYRNFELLNTVRSRDAYFYGNAFGTGEMSISGPSENIFIRSVIKSESNTRFFVPLENESATTSSEYISFKLPLDTETGDQTRYNVLRGISMAFDIEVTPDAYTELIFNPRTGDIIRGRSKGSVQLNVNSSGELEMFGSLEVVEGAYNFTTTIINKEFQIKPGGTISWLGDPYAGNLDLEASYRQIGDYYDWRPDISNSGNSLKQPVLVVLDLDGPMLQPDIGFSLELEDPNVLNNDFDWRNLITAINNNEEELKRQVFGLLMLRKFLEENSFLVGSFTGLESSVSEFVSNQLSYWINQVDDNLEVSIDLNSLDFDALNTFQLRLAYTFLDGRLRVSRGSGNTAVINQDQNSFSSIVGDWSVEYLLTEDGRFRVKAFSRPNQYQTVSSQNREQVGASVQYIRTFDEFNDLINSRKSQVSNSDIFNR